MLSASADGKTLLAPHPCSHFQPCLIPQLKQQPLFLRSLGTPPQSALQSARSTSPTGNTWDGDALCQPPHFPWFHSSLRPCVHAQPQMRTSCEPCGAAGRRITTCCVLTLLWLLTITTHIQTGKNSSDWEHWEQKHHLLLLHFQLRTHSHQSFSCFPFPFSMPRCCLAPASAVKFQDALLRAGLVPQIPPEITALTAMETRSTSLQRGQDWAQALREQIEAAARRWEARNVQLGCPGQREITRQGVTQA